MTIFCCDLEHFVNIETKVSVPPAPRMLYLFTLFRRNRWRVVRERRRLPQILVLVKLFIDQLVVVEQEAAWATPRPSGVTSDGRSRRSRTSILVPVRYRS
jgi:hypothetical protein